MPSPSPTRSLLPAALAWAAFAAAAAGQAAGPTLFVANHGNLEGSVSSMGVNADGTLTFIDKVVTGTRASLSQPCAGCNTYAIDMTSDGRFLATTHAAGSGGENVVIYEVAPDGSLEVVRTLLLSQAGLDIAWVRDDLLAVAITTSGTNAVRTYEFEPSTADLSLGVVQPAGSFLSSMATHPSGQWLYCNDLSAHEVRVFAVSGFALTLVQTLPLPLSGVAIEVTPDGRFLYAAGGISAGGEAFAGYAIHPVNGTLSALPGSPYSSGGDSPKGFTFTPDGAYMFISHGADATIRVHAIDFESGVPTDTGFSFDVGAQGTLQGMDTLAHRLFALDNTASQDGLVGAYAFDVDPGSGALWPVPGTPVPTTGIAPNDVVAWGGDCPADIDGNGVLNADDVEAFAGAFGASGPEADCDADGVLNLDDLECFVASYLSGCP